MEQPINKSNEFNLEKKVNEISLKVKDSPKIIDLSNQIDINNSKSILYFGQETSNEISQFADKILNSLETTKIEDSGKLLVQLNKIMDRFTVKDFEKKDGLLAKILKRTQHSIESLFKKYHTMGGEVDKIYLELKKFESEINYSNKNLEEMFNKNINYYEALEEYISAGNIVVEKIKAEALYPLEKEIEIENEKLSDQSKHIELSKIKQLLEMLEQRVYDLELAKNVAFQSMAQIKLIEKGNYNLVRKINSSFIITIPIFKQCLIQAITLKRQAIQAKSMAELDKRTNELLLKNAENTVAQSKITAKLASGSSIKIDTLEKTWNIIIKGIEETKKIEALAKQERKNGEEKLIQLQKDYNYRIKRN